jgi:hypothetical protein
MRARLANLLAGFFLALGISQPVLSAHDVVSEDVTEGRRVVSVRLSERLSEADLVRIADSIKAAAKTPAERTLIAFYLSGMPLNQGAWASINFDPNPMVRINGLRLEEQQQFEATVAVDRRDLVGAWVTDLPAPPGRLVIFRDNGRMFAEWVLRSGRKSVEELVEVRGTRGSRFDPRDGGQDYYLLKSTGALELRNSTRLIAVAQRITVSKPDVVFQPPKMEMATGKFAVTNTGVAPDAEGSASSIVDGNAMPGTSPGADAPAADPGQTNKKPLRRSTKASRIASDTFGFRTIFQGTR